MPSSPGPLSIHAERRLATEHATALALAESARLAEAAPRVLRAICELLGWESGALWMIDAGAERLRCVDVWHGPAVSFPEFEALSRRIVFERGIGLPGRVWVDARPTWIQNVGLDANFPRAPIATREGLRSAFGFPILLRGQVLGVLEFFSREIREPDDALVEMLTTIGSQIGLFVERRRAEEELDRFFTLSRDLFCVAGFDGFFKRLNPMWSKVLGYEAQELTAQPYFDLVHPDDRESTLAEAQKIEEGADTISFENRYRCRDGSYRWLQWAATPYPDERVIYAAARDVTERKATEAQLEMTTRALQQNAENLAQLVRELEIARQRAEEATRAKGEFLANMSHEIRTPLTAIIGMTELALAERLTAQQRDYLETVKASSDALLAIVNDVLDFSKIEAQRLELERVTFGLRDTVADAMQLMALRADEKGLELACQIDPAAPDALIGDPGRVRQVIVNLVSNALKFTPGGEIVVNVALETRTDEQVRLRFAVTDTGIGIPADKQRAIFDAFAQADSSTTRQYGGTGLGLAISSQLVKMMGGQIGVESEVGRGSTFHFTAVFDRPDGPARDEGIVEPVDVRGLRVLVVDDNATNRRIISEMLTHWHMRPHVVSAGGAALAALDAALAAGDPVGLAVLDGQMPGIDGFELARQIKRDRRFAAMPIVMLTSMGRPGDAARSRKVGVSAYLTKPVKHSDLLDAIVTSCATRRRPPGAGSSETGPPSALPSARPPLARPEASRAATVQPRQRRLRILLAEDNAVNRRLVESILVKRGHELVAVENGRQAMRALAGSTRPFDLVLMDVQMPEMGGLEATAAIRELERAAGGHVPIVAMTARAMSGDREQCLQAGMDGYLSKPIHAGELIDAAEQHAAASAASHSAPSAGSPPVLSTASGGLDERLALTHVNGDPALLREVAGLFLRDHGRQLAALRKALRVNDAAATHAAAHALKGSIAIFGARDAVHAALSLQRMGERGDLTGAAAAFETLEAHLAALRDGLTRLARHGRPGRRAAGAAGTNAGRARGRKSAAARKR